MSDIDYARPWGTYKLSGVQRLQHLLVRVGLARGLLSQLIRRSLVRRHGCAVDAEVRGIRYRLDICANTTDTKLIGSSKWYDREEIDALGRGEVFVDVGANTGYYSLTLAQSRFKRVIAIEPNPITLERLNYNIGLNDFGNRIDVAPYCVGDGEAVPFFGYRSLGSASMINYHGDDEHIMLPSKPLLAILQSAGVDRVDAMKIDIEGLEAQALMPFLDSAPDSLWPGVIVMEDCHAGLWDLDLVGWLVDKGYAIVGNTRGNVILRRSH